MRFTIGNKIFSAFGIIFAVFLVFGVIVNNKAEEMRTLSIDRINLSSMKSDLNKMIILHYQRLNELDKAIHLKKAPIFTSTYEKCPFADLKIKFKEYNPDSTILGELGQLDEAHKKFHITLEDSVQAIIKKDYQLAEKLHKKLSNEELVDMLEIYGPLFETINNEHKLRQGDRDKDVEEITTLLFIGLIMVLILIIVFYIWLKQSIVTPAAQMTLIAKEIAQGNVEKNVEYRANDEIGDFAEAFRSLISYMKELSFFAHSIGKGNLNVSLQTRSQNDMLGKALSNMAEGLNSIMVELKEGSFALNSASAEILATTSQVSSAASQTNAALAQTSASIEEIKQTANISSNKAVKTVSDAEKVLDIAKSGTSGLEENMQGLDKIKEKMDLIASNIIQLNDQSQLISEIITTVEDIANQSNMLAVNASIEAVKAGEQGKGFSVVAGELKNLADQSKNGTKQVQKILSDIQKVTGTLVMAAEQGAKAVEHGVEQAQKAKDSMNQLNTSILNASNASKQIAASYEQELSGMDQISSAMLSVKEATTQNLSSIKQVEQSAKDLSSLSQKMKQIMERYSIVQK